MATAPRKIHKRHKLKKPGSPPGSLEYTGANKGTNTIIVRSYYDEENLKVTPLEHYTFIDDGFAGTEWLDIRGFGNTALVSKLCENFHIPTLTQEDILNVHQRTRSEELENGIFIVFKFLETPTPPASLSQSIAQQISLYLTGNKLLSFQEKTDDALGIIRERLQKDQSRLRKGGVLYLTYAILDLALDHYVHYYHVLDQKTEQLEEQMGNNNLDKDFKWKVHGNKVELMQLRRMAFPMRELLIKLSRTASEREEQDKMPFLQDLQDHLLLLLDDIEECKDRLNGLFEWYNIYLQHRTNQVVQTLTIISTIFIPITFVVGVYGMNFKYMPELEWPYSYPVVLLLMALMAVGMLIFFRKRHWF